MVTNFAGCCACPQCSLDAPWALTSAALAEERAACTRMDCNMDPCALAGMCPRGEDASLYLARCQEAVCVVERRP